MEGEMWDMPYKCNTKRVFMKRPKAQGPNRLYIILILTLTYCIDYIIADTAAFSTTFSYKTTDADSR